MNEIDNYTNPLSTPNLNIIDSIISQSILTEKKQQKIDAQMENHKDNDRPKYGEGIEDRRSASSHVERFVVVDGS